MGAVATGVLSDILPGRLLHRYIEPVNPISASILVLLPVSELFSGNEVLAERGFEELQGKRIGLITNPSGVNVVPL